MLALLEEGLPWRPELFRLAYGILKNNADVEDVLQEVHLTVWQYVREGLKVRSLRQLLRVCVRNRCLDLLRQSSRSDEPLTEEAAAYGTSAEAALEAGQSWERALANLTERQQEVVDAVVHHGVDSAADELGVSARAVRRTATRALSALRDETA